MHGKASFKLQRQIHKTSSQLVFHVQQIPLDAMRKENRHGVLPNCLSLYFMLLRTSYSSIHINTKRQTDDRADKRS